MHAQGGFLRPSLCLQGVSARGADRTEVLRARVARAAAISAGVSAVVTLALLFGAGAVRALFNIPEGTGRGAFEAAALGLPFIALTNVWLGATRGLKIMRYTLYIFWVGQPLAWIVLMLAGWQFSQTPGMSVAAYSGSWALAAGAAYLAWSRESRGWGKDAMVPGDLPRLLRYAGPRAPAALFGQLLFWTDLFVVTRYVVEADVGIYSAALRAGHVVVLLLTSVNLMFSPYVADLYNRGEMARLDRLFKTLTRWIVAATLPALLLLAVAPEAALRVFGAEFAGGSTALLILLAGQFVNIATGSAGFVLIMAGRTGSFATDVWSEHFGNEIAPELDDLRCDSLACVHEGAEFSIALVRTHDAFAEDCARNDLVVTRLQAPEICRELTEVVDIGDLDRGGVHWLRWNSTASGFDVRQAIDDPERPWRVAAP
jgi:O-antigen/teichoic acid export membrane protein